MRKPPKSESGYRKCPWEVILGYNRWDFSNCLDIKGEGESLMTMKLAVAFLRNREISMLRCQIGSWNGAIAWAGLEIIDFTAFFNNGETWIQKQGKNGTSIRISGPDPEGTGNRW